MTDTACVLIIEPDILARQPLASYLRDCGFTVAEARDAAEAMELLQHDALTVSCVLADAAAEPEAIFAMSQWIRSNAAKTHVVLAGSLEKTLNEAGKLCNEGPALVKPYEHELVLSHIKRLLGQHGLAHL
jgi:DNA-binding response OmpR family regulator